MEIRNSHLDEGDAVLLRRGMEQLTTANAIMRFLSDYFRDKYRLTPQHQITPNGEIVTSQPSMFENLENSDGTLRNQERTLLPQE